MRGVSGDFARLRELTVGLKHLGSLAARAEVVRVVAEAAVKQLDDQFRNSVDPYGRPWAPLTSRTGKPLLDTGAHLRNTLAPQLRGDGFTITTAFPGAAVHQYGATIVPKRAKALAFRAGGARPRGFGRGRTGGMVFAKKVTTPRRQYMPEGQLGPRWTKAFRGAADAYLRSTVGGG